MKIYTVIPHILKIDSNRKDIVYFSIGYKLDDYFDTEHKVLLKFQVLDRIEKPRELIHKFDYYLGQKNNKKLYYKHPFYIPGVSFEMLYDDSGKTPTLITNKSYYRYAQYRFENVVPPGVHLMNLAIIELLKKHILTLHCAAFSQKKNSGGCLVFGAPNTGKSYTTYALMESGMYFLAEDMVAVDTNNVYSAPYVSTFSEYLPQKDTKYKLNNILNKIPLAGSFTQMKQSNNVLYSFIEQYPYTTKAKLENIIILERGPKQKVTSLTPSQAYKKLLLLNRMEYSYYKDDMLFAYSHFNTDLIHSSMDREEKLLKILVDSKKCFAVQAPSHTWYPRLVAKALKS